MAQTTITHLSAETDAEMLRSAAKLVQGGWTQGYDARDQNRNPVGYHQPEAACFCTLGAIGRAVMDGLGGDKAIVYTDLFEQTQGRLTDIVFGVLMQAFPIWGMNRKMLRLREAVADWNDNAPGQDAVVAILEKAATVAESNTP